jgi:hypothetical protein
MIRISLEDLDPLPSVIYLGNRQSKYGTALGFAGHTQVMNLLDRENAPYFKHCAPCQYNRIYKTSGNTQLGCPGGILHLRGSSNNTALIEESYYRVPQSPKRCRRIMGGEFTFQSTHQVPFVVNIPDYILVNRKGYEFDSNYKLKCLLAKPDATSIDDLWLGVPFVFGNTHARLGNVCLGSSQDNVNWLNWSTIQKAYLNFSRNDDWTEFWRDRNTPELSTLVDYANRLNAEGAKFVNQFAYTDSRDWKIGIFDDAPYQFDNKFVLQFQPNYKAIFFDKGGTNKFYIQLDDFSYVNTELEPAEIEDNDEW